MQTTQMFSLLEMPFLLVAVLFAFRTANALRGGAFGSGMLYIAIGALIMAFSHLNMAAYTGWDFSLFEELFGEQGGDIALVITMILSWGFTTYGFNRIYNASRSA